MQSNPSECESLLGVGQAVHACGWLSQYATYVLACLAKLLLWHGIFTLACAQSSESDAPLSVCHAQLRLEGGLHQL